MFAITFSNVLRILSVYVAYRILSRLYSSYTFARFAARNGCAEVHDHTLPFPWSLIDPLLGMQRATRVLQAGGDLFDDVLSPDFAEYRTFKRTDIDYGRRLGTIEPANLQAIVATQFEDFEVGHIRYLQFSPILGKSIFTSDGNFWQHSRALLRPQFTRDNINDLETTEASSQTLIEAIGPLDANGWTRNTELLPIIYKFTIDNATEFLFGQSLGSQAASILQQKRTQEGHPTTDQPTSSSVAEQASSEQFLSDFTLMSETSVARISFQSLYFLQDSLAFRRAIANVKRFATTFVDRALSATSANPSKSEADDDGSSNSKPNLITSLATQTRDRDEIRNQALAVLMAGRDTTAALISWSVTRLALHPDVYADLRRAVLRDFGDGSDDDDDDAAAARQPNFANLKACRPLQHFLNEVLRLHPSVPVNNRIAVRDTTLPVGGGRDQRGKIAVRKGQAVMFSVYALHRRKDLWGEDALEFKPERWEKRYPAWQYLPFHGGPRICMGQQYALTEAGYLLVRLLQKFDAIEPVDRDEMAKLRKGLGLAVWPTEGVRVRLHHA